MEASNALRWIECHPGLAAWVQAIGTIIAVMVALMVPIAGEFLVRRGRGRQTDERTAAAFLRLRAPLVSLHAEADIRLQWLERLPQDLDAVSARVWLDGLAIVIDPSLSLAAESLGLRSEFSKALLLCLESASKFNHWVNQATQFPEGFVPERWSTAHPILLDLARSMRAQAAELLEIGFRV